LIFLFFAPAAIDAHYTLLLLHSADAAAECHASAAMLPVPPLIDCHERRCHAADIFTPPSRVTSRDARYDARYAISPPYVALHDAASVVIMAMRYAAD